MISFFISDCDKRKAPDTQNICPANTCPPAAAFDAGLAAAFFGAAFFFFAGSSSLISSPSSSSAGAAAAAPPPPLRNSFLSVRHFPALIDALTQSSVTISMPSLIAFIVLAEPIESATRKVQLRLGVSAMAPPLELISACI